MTTQDLVDAMEAIAPTRYAESWDNVGLLAGDVRNPINRALLTIDYTAEVAEEAKQAGCDAVIAYHPPIFSALKRITGETAPLLVDALSRGVAIYSPHTAWDVAEGGANDVLADAIGLAERRPLRVEEKTARWLKLVVFVPRENTDHVSDAMFNAGAGQIGNYSRCAFRSEGVGSFLPHEGAAPAVGKAGTLERVDETRLESIVPLAKVAEVVSAMRKAHPYEEPAFDLITLATPPEGRGIGRVGDLTEPASLAAIVQRVKSNLRLSNVLVGPESAGAAGAVRRVACCAGAGGGLLDDALNAGAEVFLTGEMRHHDVLRAASKGCCVICCLHSNSERASLAALGNKLQDKMPGLTIVQSQRDRDPLRIL